MRFIVPFIVIFLIAFALGVLSSKYNTFPVNQMKQVVHYFRMKTREKKMGRTKEDAISFNKIEKENLRVFFTFGQSNAANWGQTRHQCKHPVYNFFEGAIYRARDPLLGAGGEGGSPWTRLGDMLIERNMADNVLIVPIAVGSTTVAQWAKGGRYHRKIIQTLDQLEEQQIPVDYFLWHQGESDNLQNTSTRDYVNSFETILETIRSKGFQSPVLLARASYHANVNAMLNKEKGIDPAIRNAQQEIIRNHPNVYPGPDTDLLTKAYHRYDGAHFSAHGLKEHAELWLKAIQNMNNSKSIP